ncbi:MAG: primosomal replication protein N [Burkholderiaceae bacterium]
MNQLVLTACLVEVSPLRYTPAGLPALNFSLESDTEVQELGTKRQVKVSLNALAIGHLAESIGKQALGSVWKFTGYLGAARQGKNVVFHIQEFN